MKDTSNRIDKKYVIVTIGMLFILPIFSGCIEENIVLDSAEIQEYNGEDLSSIHDFIEKNIVKKFLKEDGKINKKLIEQVKLFYLYYQEALKETFKGRQLGEGIEEKLREAFNDFFIEKEGVKFT